jgi:hypothetical protein
MPLKLLRSSAKSLVCESRFVECLHVNVSLSRRYYLRTQAYQCDVSDAEKTTETFSVIDKELGPVTGLIAVRGTVLRHVASPKQDFDNTECRHLCREACSRADQQGLQ